MVLRTAVQSVRDPVGISSESPDKLCNNRLFPCLARPITPILSVFRENRFFSLLKAPISSLMLDWIAVKLISCKRPMLSRSSTFDSN